MNSLGSRTRRRIRAPNVFDLTHIIETGMPVFPGSPEVSVNQRATHDCNQFSATGAIILNGHLGTHLDAPRHFYRNGLTIDMISPQAFVLDATLVRVPCDQRKRSITARELSRALRNRTDALIIETGWDKRWGRDEYYKLGPYLTEDAAHLLVEKKVRLVGVDGPTVDDGEPCAPGCPIHRILLENGMLVIENLTNLSKIPKRKFQLIALPLPIRGADGAPSRVIATC